jgi:hypothetical protein
MGLPAVVPRNAMPSANVSLTGPFIIFTQFSSGAGISSVIDLVRGVTYANAMKAPPWVPTSSMSVKPFKKKQKGGEGA